MRAQNRPPLADRTVTAVRLAAAALVPLITWVVLVVASSGIDGAELRGAMDRVTTTEPCVEESGTPYLYSPRADVEDICTRGAAGDLLGQRPLDLARVHFLGVGVGIAAWLTVTSVSLGTHRARRRRQRTPGPAWTEVLVGAGWAAAGVLVGLAGWWAGLFSVADWRDLPYDPLTGTQVLGLVLRTALLAGVVGAAATGLGRLLRTRSVTVPLGVAAAVTGAVVLVWAFFDPQYGEAAWVSPTEHLYALLGMSAHAPDGEPLGPWWALAHVAVAVGAVSLVVTATGWTVGRVRRRARRPSAA